jgi:hypothetical protein
MPSYRVYINGGRVGPEEPEGLRRSEAARSVRMFLVPLGAELTDADVPAYLVTDAMVDRYLAIEPPRLRATTDYDMIIESIEHSYVLGLYFSALSSAVVTIERLLNIVRIELHKVVPTKIAKLWGKGPLNEWEGNIEALESWGYLEPDLATELRRLFGIRCQYLHSGDISSLQVDVLAAVKGAYALMDHLIGFPPRLFTFENGKLVCLNPEDPLVKVFYPVVEANEG